MPYPPLKSENYTNFGGINRKSSQYITDKNEFLNLQNVSFQTFGALSSFPGTTRFSIGSPTSPITGLADFYVNSETQSIPGSTFPGGDTYSILSTTGNKAYNITGRTFTSVYSFLFPGEFSNFSFARNNNIFACNQFEFLRYPGTSNPSSADDEVLQNYNKASQYSLPAPFLDNSSYPFSGVSNSGGFTGVFNIATAFLRTDGLIGPASYVSITLTHGYTSLVVFLPTLCIYPTPNTSGPTVTATDFNIRGLYFWYQDQNRDPVVRSSAFFLPYQAGMQQTLAIFYGVSNYDTAILPDDYFGTFLYGFESFNGNAPFAATDNNNPKTIETYANQLFSAGFAHARDTVWYSRLGEFEKHDQDGSFDFNEKDGDIVTCLKRYFTQLIIFKNNSIGALSGTDPDTFNLTEANDQYGCITNNGACIFEDRLWFLDKKGIGEYNGANTKIISQKVENYFLRMNISAANDVAMMIHAKEMNQVWCAIPIDGSSYNNIIIIYDYVSDAWTTRKIGGDRQQFYMASKNNEEKEKVYMGDVAGDIYTFGQSLFQDYGQGYTTVIRSRFLNDLGNSVEKQFRRLYLDAAIPSGATYLIGVNFYADQGATPYLQTSMVISDFQKRIDFGIPAKDLSVEFVYSGGSYLQINGFTIEYRFQRNT